MDEKEVVKSAAGWRQLPKVDTDAIIAELLGDLAQIHRELELLGYNNDTPKQSKRRGRPIGSKNKPKQEVV